jgi:hypothetical protein
MTRARDGSERRDDDRPDRRLRRASRRSVVAVGVTGLLAGCLVTSEEEDAPDARQTGNGTDGDSDATDGGGAGGNGGGSDGDAGEATPDEVGPDGSGLVVTDATVRDVTDGGGRTRVRARLTVENAGRFEYGTVELRVDAYATPAGSEGRNRTAFDYVTRRFPVDDRFDGSRPRQFTVEITFPSRRTSVRPDSDRYVVDAAVRRAEPL